MCSMPPSWTPSSACHTSRLTKTTRAASTSSGCLTSSRKAKITSKRSPQAAATTSAMHTPISRHSPPLPGILRPEKPNNSTSTIIYTVGLLFLGYGMAPQTEARDSVFTVKGQKQASVQGKKPGLFDSIAFLLSSKQPETIEELEKKVEPAEEVQRPVAEAKKKDEPTPPKKPLFGLIGTIVPEEVEYDLFTDGPFSAEYPDWPRLK